MIKIDWRNNSLELASNQEIKAVLEKIKEGIEKFNVPEPYQIKLIANGEIFDEEDINFILNLTLKMDLKNIKGKGNTVFEFVISNIKNKYRYLIYSKYDQFAMDDFTDIQEYIVKLYVTYVSKEKILDATENSGIKNKKTINPKITEPNIKVAKTKPFRNYGSDVSSYRVVAQASKEISQPRLVRKQRKYALVEMNVAQKASRPLIKAEKLLEGNSDAVGGRIVRKTGKKSKSKSIKHSKINLNKDN